MSANQIVDGCEDLTIANFAVSRVQMAHAFDTNAPILIALNDKVRDLFVVTVPLRFAVLLRTIFRNLYRNENGMW